MFSQDFVLQREPVDHLGVSANELFETHAVLLEREMIALQLGEAFALVAELGCGSAGVEHQLLEVVAQVGVFPRDGTSGRLEIKIHQQLRTR
ncbi:hypothetical protein [Actinosynnema mirum]|nr:hypothetical protein [Actinosynnema mirum]